MWHTQPENSRTGFAITAGSVTNITFYAKTGVGTRSAQKTTSQKNPSLSPLNLTVMPLLFIPRPKVNIQIANSQKHTKSSKHRAGNY